MKRFSAALVALVFAAACSQSVPPRTRPELEVQTPAAWSTAAPDVAENWWLDFAAPDLDAAIVAALETNHDLAAAAARVAQAEATAQIAGADLAPQLGASFLATRRKQNFVGFPIPGSSDSVLSTRSTNFGVSFDLSWEADLWGRLGAGAREGLAQLQATQADLAAARLSIAGQTAKAWFAIAEAEQQVLLTERSLASFERSAAQVRDRFESGIRPPLDLRLALSQVAAAEATLFARRRQLDAGTRQLEILMGRYPGAGLGTPGQLVGLPARIPAGLPAELVARRPDIAAAERRLVAADNRLGAARGALYPRLALTASGGTSSDQLGDLVKGDFSVWSLVGNIVGPLLQGGRLRAGVSLAEAGIDEAAAVYMNTVLRAYGEVELALAAEGFLTDQVAALERTVEQSRAAEALALARYRNGLESYVTVLEAQRRTFDADSQLLAGRREHLDNRVDIYLALGGGFQAESALSPPTRTLDASVEASQ